MPSGLRLEMLKVYLETDSKEVPFSLNGKQYAAVSIILFHEDIILEKRAFDRKDPWSAQYSLPGGKYEPSDLTLKTTAIRETKEETGIDLEGEEYFGFFGPFTPLNRPGMEIYPHVFLLSHKPEIITSEEIDNAYLVSIRRFNSRDKEFVFDGIRVWGVTARILNRFCEMIGL